MPKYHDRFVTICMIILFSIPCACPFKLDVDNLKAPLYRDPVLDGVADPFMIYDKTRKVWVLFYTQRRASDLSLVNKTWCFGTNIGVATSTDNGVKWTYTGVARGLMFEKGGATFRSPHVIYHDDKTKHLTLNKDGKKKMYHLHVTYMRGSKRHPSSWTVPTIAHYTSTDLLADWSFQGFVDGLDKGSDPHVIRLKNGMFKMWYVDLRAQFSNKGINSATSMDLITWQHSKMILDSRIAPFASPCVFYWKSTWWMIVDPKRRPGLLVYKCDGVVRSDSRKDQFENAYSHCWKQQEGELLLHWAGARSLDGSEGRQPSVVLVEDDRAILLYMVHPFRQALGAGGSLDKGNIAYRQSVVQYAELEVSRAGLLSCKRDSKVPPSVKSKVHRSIASNKLKQAFSEELANEAQAKREAKEREVLFERKRVQDEKLQYEEWKKKQWLEKQGHFESMMRERKKPRKKFDLSNLILEQSGGEKSKLPAHYPASGRLASSKGSRIDNGGSDSASSLDSLNEFAAQLKNLQLENMEKKDALFKMEQERGTSSGRLGAAGVKRRKGGKRRDAKSDALRAALEAESGG